MTFEEFKETYPYTKNHNENALISIYRYCGPTAWVSNLKNQRLCFHTIGPASKNCYSNWSKEEYLELEKINEHLSKYYLLKIKMEKIKGDFTND